MSMRTCVRSAAAGRRGNGSAILDGIMLIRWCYLMLEVRGLLAVDIGEIQVKLGGFGDI